MHKEDALPFRRNVITLREITQRGAKVRAQRVHINNYAFAQLAADGLSHAHPMLTEKEK